MSKSQKYTHGTEKNEKQKHAKRIVILGAGESGAGSAILARKKGYAVWVSDAGRIEEKYKNVLYHNSIDFEEGGHTEIACLSADEVIKSPGIPEDAKIIGKIRNAGIPVISEIEFAARFTQAGLICITGSNGKTTTTLLTHHILKRGSVDAGLAGNMGKSFAREAALSAHAWYVLEISSFQLDGMFDVRANIAVLTNITPDHLDRYDNNMANYVDSKFRILNNQTPDDAFIYCADDPVTQRETERRHIAAQRFPFSAQHEIKGTGAFLYKNKTIIVRTNNKECMMNIENLALQGRHNTYNSMAAMIVAKLMDVRNEEIKESLADFQGVGHRLEPVSTVHGVEFINDSKATNVNSTWYALESMTKPVIWIVGGQDKGNDYAILKPLVAEKVKAIVCMGVDNRHIYKEFEQVASQIYEALSATEAVHKAYLCAKPGDVVLLSPACASFDLFKNYEERGNLFKRAVFEL